MILQLQTEKVPTTQFNDPLGLITQQIIICRRETSVTITSHRFCSGKGIKKQMGSLMSMALVFI